MIVALMLLIPLGLTAAVGYRERVKRQVRSANQARALHLIALVRRGSPTCDK